MADAIQTALTGLTDELIAIAVVGITIAAVPLAFRVGWRLVKGFVRS